MGYESLVLLGIAFFFAYLYIHEEKNQLLFKLLYFGVSLAFVTGVLFFNYNLASTTCSVLPSNQTSHLSNITTHVVVPLSCTPTYNTSYSYYYLTPSNSPYNLTDHFYNLTTSNYGSYTNLTFEIPAETGHFKIAQFITNSTRPDKSEFTTGIYQVHLHAGSNVSTSLSHIQLYVQVWLVAPNDNNIYMLGQTPLSQQLQGEDTEYIMNFYNNQTTITSASDRLALFIFANETDSFGNPSNVSLYMGGFANPHLSVPNTIVTDSVCPTENVTERSQVPFILTNTTGGQSTCTYNYSNSTISFRQLYYLMIALYFTFIIFLFYRMLRMNINMITDAPKAGRR
jgi:hypothetical protein